MEGTQVIFTRHARKRFLTRQNKSLFEFERVALGMQNLSEGKAVRDVGRLNAIRTHCGGHRSRVDRDLYWQHGETIWVLRPKQRGLFVAVTCWPSEWTKAQMKQAAKAEE